MKVCIVTPDFPMEGAGGRGGISTYSETLARALLSRGIEVHVVVYGEFRPPQQIRPTVPVRLHIANLPWIPYFSSVFPGIAQSMRLAWILLRLDRQHQFDVFEMYNDEGVTLFPVLLFNGRTAFRMHSSIRQHILHKGENFNWRRNFSVWLDRQAARSAQTFVTHSDFHSTEMALEYGIDPIRFSVIPHCTWPQAINSPASGNTVVGFIGTLDRRKGIDVLLDAIPGILQDFPSASFLIVGRDTGFSKKQSWKQWFESLHGPDSRVLFTGAISDDELKELWAHIGIVVVPSRYESFGLLVIEAFSRGRAVVTTCAGALPEVAGDGAILVEPGNGSQLGEAVKTLLKDEMKHADMCYRGHQRYLDLYTPEMFAERILELYSRLAGDSHRESARVP